MKTIKAKMLIVASVKIIVAALAFAGIEIAAFSYFHGEGANTAAKVLALMLIVSSGLQTAKVFDKEHLSIFKKAALIGVHEWAIVMYIIGRMIVASATFYCAATMEISTGAFLLGFSAVFMVITGIINVVVSADYLSRENMISI